MEVTIANWRRELWKDWRSIG